ncbi:26272_t:CDS:2 [Dentiscutata erythropus]|uniref:26272_t:CDS:1 n=1 Tax=Dentiscutata erythropus TaxID=1348616 RepID=A0A9N9BL30_9GLOM|nr:26272_t:CDS:2 [Dentiscutata erythropus]
MACSTDWADWKDVIQNSITRNLNSLRGYKYSKLREDMIESVIERAQHAFSGECNVVYLRRIAFVYDDNRLTQEEKDDAILSLTMIKDRYNLLYGKDVTYRCDICDRSGYMIVWCQHCVVDFLQDEATKWTSMDKHIDRQILLAQTRAPIPEAIPEWIPYELLRNVDYLTQGGYASVYTATYMRGLYTRWMKTTKTLSRGLTHFKVVLKKLNWNQPENDFKNELEKHLYVSSVCNAIVRCYGVTRDPVTKDYMLVLNRMKCDLREYIGSYHSIITWSDINHMCKNIVSGLFYLHKEGLVHRDLHPGNILRGRIDNNWYIADLGFTGPPDHTNTTNNIVGNLSYIAPEILTKKEYSAKSDIYAFGMVLYYATTFKPPFAGQVHDKALQLEIFRGTRPILSDVIPRAFTEIIRRCWDADPNKRPKAGGIANFFSKIKIKGGFVPQNATTEVGSEISTITSGISTTKLAPLYDTGDSSGASCAINFSIDI